MKKRIILDTNFLMIPARFKVDIFAEIERVCHFSYDLVVLKETAEELKRITAGSKGKDGKAAKLGLQLLKRFKVKTIEGDRKLFKRADEAILAVADKNSIVATQDMQLKRQLAGKCPLIAMRQKSHLQLFGG